MSDKGAAEDYDDEEILLDKEKDKVESDNTVKRNNQFKSEENLQLQLAPQTTVTKDQFTFAMFEDGFCQGQVPKIVETKLMQYSCKWPCKTITKTNRGRNGHPSQIRIF